VVLFRGTPPPVPTPLDLPDLTTARLDALIRGHDRSGGWLEAYKINDIENDFVRALRWPQWKAAIDGLGPELWRLVGARLDAALRQAGVRAGARVVWLPTGALGILPLGLAQDPASKRRLADRWEIVYAPSLEALTEARERIAETRPATLGAVVNPTRDIPRWGLPAAEQEGGLVASYFAARSRTVLAGPRPGPTPCWRRSRAAATGTSPPTAPSRGRTRAGPGSTWPVPSC
jgi:hypothetical protein